MVLYIYIGARHRLNDTALEGRSKPFVPRLGASYRCSSPGRRRIQREGPSLRSGRFRASFFTCRATVFSI